LQVGFRGGGLLSTEYVLVVVLDTVRADHLSLYGYERATTPELERWAESRGAAVYPRAYSPSNWTAPAHLSLFTAGRWATAATCVTAIPRSGRSRRSSTAAHIPHSIGDPTPECPLVPWFGATGSCWRSTAGWNSTRSTSTRVSVETAVRSSPIRPHGFRLSCRHSICTMTVSASLGRCSTIRMPKRCERSATSNSRRRRCRIPGDSNPESRDLRDAA
jgi:hypothetical protein